MIQILTIKEKLPLYKGEELANKIELLQFEEVDFEVVRMKDLNEVGDKLLFIYPDYCLPNTDLFKSYTNPETGKSKLGSNNRIRAVKFNLHRGDNKPVYSNGIVLDQNDLKPFNINTVTEQDLGITKYVETELLVNNLKTGGKKQEFPAGMYKTDEPNILSCQLAFPFEYTGTVKVDGSSITLWYKDGESGICSRNILKSMTKQVFDYRRNPTFIERLKSFFGFKVDLNVYKDVPNDDTFVKIGKPYLDILVRYCKETGQNLCLRGELCGMGLNGSGNKHNPHNKLTPQILFFGVDTYYDYGTAKENYDILIQTLVHLCNMSDLQFNNVEFVFKQTFNNKKEIVDYCNTYFETHLIEGIVVENTLGQHAKILSLDYDSKK